MAWDEQLAERIEGMLAEDPRAGSRRMFGGLAWFIDGNMACGVIRDIAFVRVGPAAYAEALALPEAEVFPGPERAMTGIVSIDGAHLADDDGTLRAWVGRGVDFAGSLPPK